MATFSYQADKATINRILQAFPATCFQPAPEYAHSKIQLTGCTIVIYNSDKVVFQGTQAEHYATGFFPAAKQTLPQAGSDEVGTGDFFGPVCVCGCLITSQVNEQLKDYHIVDSKQLTDDTIRTMAIGLKNIVPHSLVILEPVRYNTVIATNNMNRIKARLHNQCYLNLKNKGYQLPQLIVIDQFCAEDLYYRYLQEEKEVISNIHFQPRAENSFLAVGCGAILARAAFIDWMEQAEKKWKMPLPKGAGLAVDEAAKTFIATYGKEEFSQIAKLNFKNSQRL